MATQIVQKRTSAPLAILRRLLLPAAMRKPIPVIETTHILHGVSAEDLAPYMQQRLGVPNRDVVERDGCVEMPFRIWGIEGATLTIAECSIGAKFTMTAPPTSDIDLAINNAVKITKFGMLAAQAATRDLSRDVLCIKVGDLQVVARAL
jgi:hypothetical protein